MAGRADLQKAGRAGRKPELDQRNRERLHALFLEGPEQQGYETRAGPVRFAHRGTYAAFRSCC
jgi:hypothetical protein